MAITNNGTENKLPEAEIPTGYTRPVITTFSVIGEYQRELTLTVLKATVQNATPSTTMTNIFDDATIGLDKQISDIVAATYLATATINTFAQLVAMTDNIVVEGADFLTAEATSYVCTVRLFVQKV